MNNAKIKEIIGTNKFEVINTFPTLEFFCFCILFFGLLCTIIFSPKNYLDIITLLILLIIGYYIYTLYFDTAHKIIVTNHGVIIEYRTKVSFYTFKDYSIDHDVISSFRGPPSFHLIFKSSQERKIIQIHTKYKTFRYIFDLIEKHNK